MTASFVSSTNHCAECSIAPPFLLDRLIEEGTPEQREAALETLATSTALRTRRAIIGDLIKEPNVDIDATGLIPEPTGLGKRRSVYDAENVVSRSALPGTLKRDEDDPPVDDRAVNEAFDGAGLTYDFYEQVLGRDSIDAKGLEIVSSVHFGLRYENAMWSGGQMLYGDGGGQIFLEGSLTTSLDVIGHELTHGITQFTAGLRYRAQSGALNESFSDVFGSLVKQHAEQQTAAEADWLIGAGILRPEIGQALQIDEVTRRRVEHRSATRPHGRLPRAAPRRQAGERLRRRAHQLGHPEPCVLSRRDGARRSCVGEGGPHLVRDPDRETRPGVAVHRCRECHHRCGRHAVRARRGRAGGGAAGLAGGRRALSTLRPMKLSVVRGGGLAGIVTHTELATGALPPETEHALRARLTQSGLLDIRESASSPDPTPDALQYEITVEDAGTTRRVRLSEDEMPDPVRSFISWLESVPEREERVEAPGSH